MDLLEEMNGLTPRLRLTTTGDLDLATGKQLVAQRVRSRLMFIRNEWFMDRTLGLPLFDEEMTRPKNESLARAYYRSAIEQTPGVSSILEMNFTEEKEKRVVRFKVLTDANEVIHV